MVADPSLIVPLPPAGDPSAPAHTSAGRRSWRGAIHAILPAPGSHWSTAVTRIEPLVAELGERLDPVRVGAQR